MGTKNVRKGNDNKRFLQKRTWDNIRHVGSNLWSCKVIYRDGFGKLTSRLDAILFLDGNILILREKEGKSSSITHKRPIRKYEGNSMEPIEGIWQTSKSRKNPYKKVNRYKIKGNTSVCISHNKRSFMDTISIRNIKYIANDIWVGEKSWRYTSGKVASWNYTILELYEGYLYLTTPSKKWSGKYSRIDSQNLGKNTIPTKKRSNKLIDSKYSGKKALAHSKIIGTWKGRGCQSNGSCWTIKIHIPLFKSNDVIKGTISYPSLKCKARLKFVRWENNTAVFRERYIKRGSCVENGWLYLTPKANKRLDYIWAWPNGKKDAHAVVALVE